MHACSQRFIYSHIPTFPHIYIYYMYTYIHSYMHTSIHSYSHTYIYGDKATEQRSKREWQETEKSSSLEHKMDFSPVRCVQKKRRFLFFLPLRVMRPPLSPHFKVAACWRGLGRAKKTSFSDNAPWENLGNIEWGGVGGRTLVHHAAEQKTTIFLHTPV